MTRNPLGGVLQQNQRKQRRGEHPGGAGGVVLRESHQGKTRRQGICEQNWEGGRTGSQKKALLRLKMRVKIGANRNFQNVKADQ